mmetsp:Transcript_2721/g.4658  ORF Transcript_2721/g.4658 Transcript_2721/m.4658 type:complete len:419 (-) Transcript_2721:26-1282(-)
MKCVILLFLHGVFGKNSRFLLAYNNSGGDLTKRDSPPMKEESDIVARANAMAARADNKAPLVDEEIERIIHSLEKVQPNSNGFNKDDLKMLLADVGHLSHKDWDVTKQSSEKLRATILPEGLTPTSRLMFRRVLNDGNWDGAVAHGRESREKPWAVLVTGVNGIRKTTSMYQRWFPDVLREALVCPIEGEGEEEGNQDLPHGGNSFFRQLDHMIATLCNQEFADLYRLTRDEVESNGGHISPEVIKKYSDLKAAIFSRYRTVSELLGVVLIDEARKESSNCMMETSGRDVAMFHYVDALFGEDYRKLALHFTINDLSYGRHSVDSRMVQEIKDGMKAIEGGHILEIIEANAGGPYGSEVLDAVQQASDSVWKEMVQSGLVGSDWYKATIAITAHTSKSWTAHAVRPDGTAGKAFRFTR